MTTDPDPGARWLRPKQVAAMLGVSRHTLRRMVEGSTGFPRFIQMSAGIRVVRQREVERWLRRQELRALEQRPRARAAPKRATFTTIDHESTG